MKLGILFAIAGGIMGSAGIGYTDWQLYALLIAMAASYAIGRTA